VQNYIIYYIAALAESKVAFMQNNLKIRSPNSSVGTNPSTVKLLGAKLLSRTCVLNSSELNTYDGLGPLTPSQGLVHVHDVVVVGEVVVGAARRSCSEHGQCGHGWRGRGRRDHGRRDRGR
jgi:hypothetical protein